MSHEPYRWSGGQKDIVGATILYQKVGPRKTHARSALAARLEVNRVFQVPLLQVWPLSGFEVWRVHTARAVLVGIQQSSQPVWGVDCPDKHRPGDSDPVMGMETPLD